MSEFYIISPTDSDIQHHGIIGQSWGNRNGPPYPLSKSVSTGKRLKRKERKAIKVAEKAERQRIISEEEKAKRKEAIINSGNARAVLAIQSQLTTDELRDAVNRVKLYSELADYSAKQITTKWDKAKKMGDRAKDVVNWTDTGIRAWNDFAKIYNAATENKDKNPLPQIGEKKKDKK